MAREKATIAIATGDPAGIGPEISIKAALDPAVRAACRPVLVGDPDVLARHAEECGIATKFHVTESVADADDGRLCVRACPQPEAAALPLGRIDPTAGRASIAVCAAAIKAALDGEADAVAAAPQHETSIARAGIAFDGHPSFVARQTGTPEDAVYMMLSLDGMNIAHATLHQSVRDALAAITRERVGRVIAVTDGTLRSLGMARPRIAVSGVNPHAGENGLFGREEIDVVTPAIEAARAGGIGVEGPFGADTMFHMKGYDAFVVMLHDQGHVAAKVLAPNAVVAFTIGTPILFASVAHGTGHDIAGKGVASPAAMIAALLKLAMAKGRSPPSA